MINYEWQIFAKPTSQDFNGLKDFIIAVVSVYKGTDDTSNISYSMPCTTFFIFNSKSDFIPFDEVTDEIVISWLESREDVSTMQAEIEAKINEIPIIEKPIEIPIIEPLVP